MPLGRLNKLEMKHGREKDHVTSAIGEVKMRVLVVEDDKNVVNIIRLTLEAERCEVALPPTARKVSGWHWKTHLI
jgi:hypothetical protein